jgi:hypothetical protein
MFTVKERMLAIVQKAGINLKGQRLVLGAEAEGGYTTGGGAAGVRGE